MPEALISHNVEYYLFTAVLARTTSLTTVIPNAGSSYLAYRLLLVYCCTGTALFLYYCNTKCRKLLPRAATLAWRERGDVFELVYWYMRVLTAVLV